VEIIQERYKHIQKRALRILRCIPNCYKQNFFVLNGIFFMPILSSSKREGVLLYCFCHSAFTLMFEAGKESSVWNGTGK
jgi:hypothetical protein